MEGGVFFWVSLSSGTGASGRWRGDDEEGSLTTDDEEGPETGEGLGSIGGEDVVLWKLSGVAPPDRCGGTEDASSMSFGTMLS